jgi:hypothetical protein
MRISQLQSLNGLELALLIYIVNEVEPISSPRTVIMDKNELLWIRSDQLLLKLARQESKMTDEGKIIFKGLMEKLSKTPAQEIKEQEQLQKLHAAENLKQTELTYEYPTITEPIQSNFQF